MRIWSIHPKYLDNKGLIALWREVLLAKKVLEGKTKGYKNHPQMNRFKISKKPINNINLYLSYVYNEAFKRGYNFDKSKIDNYIETKELKVTHGQLDYEWSHLLNKLKLRDPKKYEELTKLKKFEHHPIFTIVKGNIEDWEIVNQKL